MRRLRHDLGGDFFCIMDRENEDLKTETQPRASTSLFRQGREANFSSKPTRRYYS